MSTSVMSPMPIASAVTCEPSGIAKSAGWPETWRGGGERCALDRFGVDVELLDLRRGDFLADVDVLGGDEDGLEDLLRQPLRPCAG